MEMQDELAAQFERERAYLGGVAYRILGSGGEADDAVQEAWLRLSRAGGEGIASLRAWLTTVVARIALDMLRARAARREEPEGDVAAAPASSPSNPERELALAEAWGWRCW